MIGSSEFSVAFVINRLKCILFIAIADAATPEWVYGFLIKFKKPWTVPSSPNFPCKALKQTSTFNEVNSFIPFKPISTSVTLKSFSLIASAHASADLRETSRSEPKPPFNNITCVFLVIFIWYQFF